MKKQSDTWAILKLMDIGPPYEMPVVYGNITMGILSAQEKSRNFLSQIGSRLWTLVLIQQDAIIR
jgi:hypothetical protein